ncbi:50S ribosomal protein L18 [Chlamydiales bacterium SCGC AB-751-O23]|jgi:large subunit ribosomal protein L18|nr:50S ribosomal protein L18 [Chlamydiales bacterium SCGC AB-751-O23]
MENNLQKKKKLRFKRACRVRNGIHGTSERPRLCVFRSNQNIYGQLINDDDGKTLAAFSSLSKELGLKERNKDTKNIAEKVGQELAKKAIDKGFKKVRFDRGCFKYHGAVKALAEAAREAGLEF